MLVVRLDPAIKLPPALNGPLHATIEEFADDGLRMSMYPASAATNP
jgi:hypothetical protein